MREEDLWSIERIVNSPQDERVLQRGGPSQPVTSR
jgi:hypothetical protein